MLDQLSLAVFRLADFCADVKAGHFPKPFDIIRAALSIDAELVSLLITVPPAWNYSIAKVPAAPRSVAPTPHVWSDTYHVYDSITASCMWNNYRCARILVQELILDTLSTSSEGEVTFPQQHALEAQCRQTALHMVEDICASVPFSLGSELEMDGASDAAHAATSPACAGFMISGSGGLTLMWPLLVAANSGVASEDMRVWIAGCLDKVGHSMGINQALATSRLLQGRMKSRVWLSPEYEKQEVN